MNFARLNHILIPSTLEGRERLRKTRLVRLLRPFGWFYGALSEEGRAMTLVIMFVGTASLEVSRTQVYMLWALLLGLLVASLALRRFYALENVTLEAHTPERVAVGATMAFQLTLASSHHRSHHAIRLRGAFLPWDGAFSGKPPRTAELEAGKTWVSQIQARFVERGPHHIEPFTACALLPFGLAVGPHVQSRGCRFTVVPRLAPIASFRLPHADSQHRGGVTRAVHRGEAMELRGVRPYRRGDPVRDLHPKTWARAGVPHVREYQQEYFSRVGVFVDNDRTGGSENGFEAVLSLAGGVVAEVTRGEALLSAIAIGEETSPMDRGSAAGALDGVLDLLAHAKTGGALDVDATLDRLEPVLSEVSSMIVVTQSTDPSRLALIAGMAARGVAVRLLRVHDDTGPAWLARRRKLEPPRSSEEQVVLASDIRGEAPIAL